MVKLEKDNLVKVLDPSSSLIHLLLQDGWVEVVEEKPKKKVKKDDDSA